MNILHLFRPGSSLLFKEELGLNFISPVGVNFSGKKPSARYLKFALDTAFSFAVTDSANVSSTIDYLKTLPRETNIFIHLDKNGKYLFENKKKSMESAFAILYDFVDAFIISGVGADKLEEVIDPILNLRLYNYEYRPVLLEIKDNTPLSEMDRILDFSMSSNVDGLFISNVEQLKYASGCAGSRLVLVADGILTQDELKASLNYGASLVTLSDKGRRNITFNPIITGRNLTRSLIKETKAKLKDNQQSL